MLRLVPETSSLLIRTLSVHSPAFFPEPLPSFFPVLTVANTGSCVGPQNKKGHPVSHFRQLMQVECPRNINRIQNMRYCLSRFAFQTCGYNLRCAFTKTDQRSLSSAWSYMRVALLTSAWSHIRVALLTSAWSHIRVRSSFISVVYHQRGLTSGWFFSHQRGLTSGWLVSHQRGLTLGRLVSH